MIIRKVKVTEYEYQAPINYVAGATEPDIQFQLTDYEIPSGATGRVYVGRSDGTFEYTVATISGNNVTVAPTSSMFSVKGPGAIQVTLYVGNEVVKNFAVPVYVHADLADDSAEAGSDVTGVFRAAEEEALADFQEQAEEIVEEVIESIPADYTELTEEVDELNERLGDKADQTEVDDLKDDLNSLFYNSNVSSMWEQGGIAAGTGENQTATGRIRTISYIPDNVVSVSVAEEYKYVLAGYNASGVYQGLWNGSSFEKTPAFLTDPTEINHSNGYKYRLVLGLVSNEDITPSVYSNMTIYAFTDETLTKSGIAADAKAVGDAISSASSMDISKKKFLFIGDSYAQGYSHDGSNPGWCNYLVNYLSLSSEQYTIAASGGAGFGNDGFTTLLQEATGTGYTDIIVCGGYNDNNQTAASIRQGIQTFMSAVSIKYPKAVVSVGFIASNTQGLGDGAIENWVDIHRALKETVLQVYQRCAMYGCKYLNNVEYWLDANGQRGLSKSDGYHPNETGNQYIAWGIANALRTGSASLPGYDYDKTVSVSRKQLPEIREILMAQDNIGMDHTSDTMVFEKLISPIEINPYKLYVYANNTLSIMEASYACYKKYSVTPGETYYLSGRHYFTNYPFYLLLNSSGNVIDYYNGGAIGHDVNNYELVIPNNAVTLIVQGQRVFDGARITVTQIPEVQADSVYSDSLIMLKYGDFSKWEWLQVNYGSCVRFPVDPQIGYCIVGGRHYFTDYPLYIIVDANNNVLKYHDGGANGYDNDIYYTSVPANGAYIYVNVTKGFESTVKLYKNGTYYTLKNYVGQKIDGIVNQFMTTTVTPQMFGAKANGVADDTLAITNAIDAAQGGTVRFPKGTYAISSPIKTFRGNSKCTELVFDEGAVVVAISQVPYILELGVLGNDGVVDHVRKTLRGGLFDGSNGNVTTAVVHIGRRCMTLDMSDFQIYSNGCDGLHVGDSDTVTPIDANIHNGFIKNTGSNNSNSGIKIFGTDNNLSDLRIYYYQKAIEVLASAQFLNDIHTMPKNVATPATTSLYIGDNVHVNCSNFYGDSEDTFVYMGNNSILIGNNLYYYSYRSNSVTFFDVHSNPKIMVSGFHLYGKDSDYIGVKLNSGNLKDVLSKGNFVVTGLDMDNAQYIRNGDPLKCAIASNGQPLFNTTSISANTWYYVCSYPADANTEHWFKLFNGFKHTVIPVNVKYSSGLVDELLSNVVDSDDTNVFDIGFSLLNTTSGYALINVYVKASTATKISDFWVESKLAVGGSSAYQKSDTALSSVSVTPTIAYRVDCANKTVTKLT